MIIIVIVNDSPKKRLEDEMDELVKYGKIFDNENSRSDSRCNNSHKHGFVSPVVLLGCTPVESSISPFKRTSVNWKLSFENGGFSSRLRIERSSGSSSFA